MRLVVKDLTVPTTLKDVSEYTAQCGNAVDTTTQGVSTSRLIPNGARQASAGTSTLVMRGLRKMEQGPYKEPQFITVHIDMDALTRWPGQPATVPRAVVLVGGT